MSNHLLRRFARSSEVSAISVYQRNTGCPDSSRSTGEIPRFEFDRHRIQSLPQSLPTVVLRLAPLPTTGREVVDNPVYLLDIVTHSNRHLHYRCSSQGQPSTILADEALARLRHACGHIVACR